MGVFNIISLRTQIRIKLNRPQTIVKRPVDIRNMACVVYEPGVSAGGMVNYLAVLGKKQWLHLFMILDGFEKCLFIHISFDNFPVTLYFSWYLKNYA